MIDEFQDTNVVQYAIAKQLSEKNRNLCVVGDPDQSIYSWRNADIRNILSFQTDYPEAKVVTLEENYRSTQTILDASQELIAPNEQRVESQVAKLWRRSCQRIEGRSARLRAPLKLRRILATSAPITRSEERETRPRRNF